MSDYHVLTVSPDKKTVTVVFRIPIPDETNQAGKNYRTALVEKLTHESPSGTIESKSPFSTSEELSQVQNGEVYEVLTSVRFSSLSLTNAQRRDELDAKFEELKTKALAQLKTELEWWGYKRDVTT